MLTLAAPNTLRDTLSYDLQKHATTEVCWQLGQRSTTPSVAFFVGYQAAMRCLDSKLPSNSWAALLVSEKGVKHPSQMQTQFDVVTGELKGAKSHTMMANSGLNTVYIMAKTVEQEPEELVLLKVSAEVLTVLPAKPQAVMREVPHHEVQFACHLTQDDVYRFNAHETVNKPFRYWEDVHVLLALAGWMFSQLESQQAEVLAAAVRLQQAFAASPNYYTLESLDAVEKLLAVLQNSSAHLAAEASKIWQQDSMLFLMLKPIWQKIRSKFID